MSEYIVRLIRYLGRHPRKILYTVFLLIPLLMIARSTIWSERLFIENDAGRAALPMPQDTFGDRTHQVVYLNQGWSASDSKWFYTTTQGSNLLPYDFFIVLEQAGSTEAFNSAANMNRYRYLPQRASKHNPDALPVGMVADEYRGKKFMGFTCAACHTSQVNYQGTGIRIDGGSSMANMSEFLQGMIQALNATMTQPDKKQRFIDRVKRLGHYDSQQEIEADLAKYKNRIEVYTQINHSNTAYGYARLDAFGRIYNRVLQYVITEQEVEDFLNTLACDEKDQACQNEATHAKQQFKQSLASKEDRDQIVERTLRFLNPEQRKDFITYFFNPSDAPVSYPFLWDIAQHDYVQWNGLAENSGFGPIGRNTGEVIGVFATLDWQKRPFTPFMKNPISNVREHFRSYVGGQGLFSQEYVDFTSSVDSGNLHKLENHLIKLTSPKWQDAIALPVLDQKKVKFGEKLFVKNCVACHEAIKRDDPDRRIIANMTKLEKIGTDPKMANNGVGYKGSSGLVRHFYVSTTSTIGNILIQDKSPVAAILTKATLNVVATPDADKWFFTRFGEWAYNLIDGYFNNTIQPSIKAGDYTPDTTASPYASLKAYKGRPLNGIWATGPYLHNGSVPTLYHLLLPAAQRPKSFMVGSRELDVEKVGFRFEGYGDESTRFDTSLPANSNLGHEYGTHDTMDANGNLLQKALTEEDRWALIEYLKSL